jgi:ribosomal protein S26
MGLDSNLLGRQSLTKGWISVARRTVLVCDNCGKEVGENKGASLRVTFTDARRGSKVADLCDNCAAEMPGRAAARRGRRPKSAVPG